MISKLKLKLKKLKMQLTGQVKHLKKGINCKYEWYGNQYGGFYLNPELLGKEAIVYSFGIGEDITFDLEVIRRHQANVYGFDPTPKSINWVTKNVNDAKFIFLKYGISNESGFVNFFLPRIQDHVSGSLFAQQNVDTQNMVKVEVKRLSDIAKQLGHKYLDVLKMDIEGAEYDVIEDILSSGIDINQIAIEFHDRFVEKGRQKTIAAINSLRKNGYEIFAVSDSYEEVSFIKTSILKAK